MEENRENKNITRINVCKNTMEEYDYPIDLSNTEVCNGSEVCYGEVKLKNIDCGIKFKHYIIQNSTFENLFINNLWFDDVYFRNCEFNNCTFSETSFIRWCKFDNCKFIDCNGVIKYIKATTFQKNCTYEDTRIRIRTIDEYIFDHGKRIGRDTSLNEVYILGDNNLCSIPF